ncbi:MAG: DinB family protein [Planctomycetota bacterium]
MTHAELLAEQLEWTREWTLRLIADLEGADWSFQPGLGLAHPLWLCGHLACSQDILIFGRCLGQSGVIDDSFKSHFAIGGPVKSTTEHKYPPLSDVLSTMRDVHAKTLEAVRGMSDDLLAQPAFAGDGKSPHPHYKDKRGAASHCSRHEAFHAGQIALIRRLLGRTFLR